MSIIVNADRDQDQLYIALSPASLKKGAVRRTVRINEDIALDYSARGKLLGIEIMNASNVVGASFKGGEADALLGVKEAASIAGVRPSNFVRDYADKPGFPKPIANLSSGRVWSRSEVLGYLRRLAPPARRRAS